MPLAFPTNPAPQENDTYEYNGKTFVYTGVKWRPLTSSSFTISNIFTGFDHIAVVDELPVTQDPTTLYLSKT
jgi:hypothetical protein